jgi:putative transcriptional regulator
MTDKTPMEAALEIASDLGFDKATMKEIEQLAIPKVDQLSPNQIKKLRADANCSQAIMACYLNVNLSTYQKWERGETIPKGAPLKLLNIVEKHGIQTLAS